MNIKDCFKEDFTEWLLKSNNQSIKQYTTKPFRDVRTESQHFDFYTTPLPQLHQSKLDKLVEESLEEILDILLREPLADYFWYGYPEHGGKLSYSSPHSDVVPGDALRVDKDKVKTFLRNYKIESILN